MSRVGNLVPLNRKKDQEQEQSQRQRAGVAAPHERAPCERQGGTIPC
jgi:hypothetical protein